MSKLYISTAPNAVEKIWCGNVSYAPQQDISYTSFNKSGTITEGNYQLEYSYGPDQQRRKSVLTNTGTGNIEKTIIYAGAYEEVAVNGNTYKVHYIAGGSGLAAINVRHNGADQMFYVYTDHLGSIIKLTDNAGNFVYETNFDAWGRERNPNTWDYTANPNTPPEWLIRGFTGHEHLKEFALINMNGRMYDPMIGRVLSPDNNIADPFFTQDHNRYSYVLNNPLKYTDPDGEWVQFVIGAVVGGFAGWQIGEAQGAKGWGMFGYIAAGAGIGALTGGVAAGVSAAGGGAIAAGMAAGAVGGAGFSGLATNWNADAMAQGAFYGAISGGVGAGVGAAIGGEFGAFAGGAVGSGVNTALYGGSAQDVGISALAGGTMAFGIYHASSYLSWQFEGGNKWGDMDISYRQYTAMQADFQRSRFWEKEYGGALMNDGSVQRFPASSRADYGINDVKLPSDAKGWYHTHWDVPGKSIDITPRGNLITPGNGYTGVGYSSTTERYHSPADLSNASRSIVINRYDASYYPGYGNYSTINPPINRFVWSFYFWR